MNKNDAFPSTYLKAADFTEDVQLTIRQVEMEPVGGSNTEPAEMKAVAHFDETQKGLVLNMTNWDSIEVMYGPESPDWIGKKVVLYPTQTSFRGKLVAAIRVRVMQAPQPATPAAPAQQPAPVIPAQPQPTQQDGPADAFNVNDDGSVPF